MRANLLAAVLGFSLTYQNKIRKKRIFDRPFKICNEIKENVFSFFFLFSIQLISGFSWGSSNVCFFVSLKGQDLSWTSKIMNIFE